MKVFILVVAFLAVCYAQLTQTDIATILSLHNDARANAVPVPATPLKALVWNASLALEAQTWVNGCSKSYSPKRSAGIYGENAILVRPLDFNLAFNAWFAQSTSFNFADKTCTSVSGCSNYLQIVSEFTTVIGCGYASCTGDFFFTCYYKTFAQYSGKLPYTPSGSQPSTPKPTAAPIATPKPTTKPTTKPSSTVGTASSSSSGTATTGSSSGYASIDYRGTKSVLGVHDQKQCGSCWAFSTVAIVEGALGKRGLTIPLLSDQNVLDCSASGSCDGGWTATALSEVVKRAGINSQSEYPYTQAKGTCKYNAATSQGAITKNGQTKGDFASIYNALVTYGPVGIAVYADSAWNSYKSGVLSTDYTSVNHAVTVVGYDAGLDAWIVKNSWGSSWGISGFIYLAAKHPAGAQVNGAFWAL